MLAYQWPSVSFIMRAAKTKIGHAGHRSGPELVEQHRPGRGRHRPVLGTDCSCPENNTDHRDPEDVFHQKVLVRVSDAGPAFESPLSQ